MKRVNKLHGIYLFTTLFLTIPTFSQEVSITGLVVNSNQEPVSNVQVILAGSPEIYCYTNQSGEFQLTDIATSLPEQTEQADCMNLLENGSIEIKAFNQSFKMTIVDLLGRIVSTCIDENNLNGNYSVFPDAYIQDLPAGIYIARAMLGEQAKSFKICNFNRTGVLKGFIQTGYADREKQSVTKHTLNIEDTLIFSHDFYKTTRLAVFEQNLDVGTVQLENFSNYSPAEGVVPDKITYNHQYGSFIKVNGHDSSQFILNIDAYSTLENELKFRAIPVKDFEFLDSSFTFISGIHLEPSGTHFYFPVQVNVELNKLENTDSLLIILHNSETGKVCFLPYLTHEPYLKNINIEFLIAHFSDIVVVKGEMPNISGTKFIDSDDATSYIAFLIAMGLEVTDALFSQWYNDVVKHEITSIFDMETLEFAIHDLMLMEQYALYANKSVDQLDFYNEAITNISNKMGYLFGLLKEECSNLEDQCLKKDLALIAVQLNIIAQKIDGIEEVNLSEMCGGEVLDVVNKIIFNPLYYSVKTGETAQIKYTTENLQNQAFTAPLEWYSENPEIAQVDGNGLITGIKDGQTRVFAKSCDIKEAVIVDVSSASRSYCSDNREPFTGKFYSRIFIHGYVNDIYQQLTINLHKSIELTLMFNAEGDDEYDGVVHSSYHLVKTRWVDGQYVTDVSYSNTTSKLQWYEHGHLNCVSYGWYNTTQHDQLLHIKIYPESRIILADDVFRDQIIVGTGIF